MARIPKLTLKPREIQFLTEQGLIFDKNQEVYGVRDKDLDRVLDLIKTNSLNEAVESEEDINKRVYVLRVTTLIMRMIKEAKTLTDKIGILSSINSLYPLAPEDSIRLLALLKGTVTRGA